MKTVKTAHEMGKIFKKRRKELGLTQRQIYERTGISTGNLSCIETGRCNASLDAFLKLVNVLDIPCTEIFNLKDFNSLSVNETTMVDVYRSLSPQQQIELQNYASYLSSKNTQKTKISDKPQK